MKRRSLRLLALVGAFVILAAGDCSIGDLGNLLDKPGQVVVSNTGTEPAVISITADDAKSYPTLAGGSTASIQTNVGGTYNVRVVMTPENAQQYRADLAALRQSVERQIAGTASSTEKTQLFLKLAGIKLAIQSLEIVNASGCSGSIQLNRNNAATVNATVTWVPEGTSGFWDTTCGSNSGSGE